MYDTVVFCFIQEERDWESGTGDWGTNKRKEKKEERKNEDCSKQAELLLLKQ